MDWNTFKKIHKTGGDFILYYELVKDYFSEKEFKKYWEKYPINPKNYDDAKKQFLLLLVDLFFGDLIKEIKGKIRKYTVNKTGFDVILETGESNISRIAFKQEFEKLISKKFKHSKIESKMTGLSGSVETTILDKDFKIAYKDSKSGLSNATENTSKTEEAQADICNICIKHSLKEYKEIEKNQEVIDYFRKKGISIDWQNSIIIGAEVLMNNIKKQGKYERTKYGKSKIIYDKFNELNKNYASRFSNENKWTPADIWFISNDANFDDIKKAVSIPELNSILLDNFKSQKIIGISLKKLENYGKCEFDIPKTINFDDVYVESNSNIFNSMDIYIKSKDDKNKIQFRLFRGMSGVGSWEAEIKSVLANGGKIGGGVIFNNILPDLKVKIDLTPQDVFEEIVKNKNPLNILKMLHQKAPEVKLFNFNVPKWDEFLISYNNLKESDKWLFSKFMNINLLYHLETEENLCKFFSASFNYAQATSKDSAVFFKLH